MSTKNNLNGLLRMQIILDEKDITNLPEDVRASLLLHMATQLSLNENEEIIEEIASQIWQGNIELSTTEEPVASPKLPEKVELGPNLEKFQVETIPNEFVRHADRPLLKFDQTLAYAFCNFVRSSDQFQFTKQHQTTEVPFEGVSDLSAWGPFGILTAMFGFGGHTLPGPNDTVAHLLPARTPNDVLENMRRLRVQINEGENARVLSPYFKRITNLLRAFTGIPGIHWYNIDKNTGEYRFAEESDDALFAAIRTCVTEVPEGMTGMIEPEFDVSEDGKNIIRDNKQWLYASREHSLSNRYREFCHEYVFDETMTYKLTGQEIRRSVPRAPSNNPTGRYAIFEQAIPQAETVGEANKLISQFSPVATKDADIFIAALTGYIEFIDSWSP
jgi:hypothetical protein